MTDALSPYREAHGQTEEALIRISGLARALYELTSEHPALNNPDPVSNAILSLVVVLEEKAEQAGKQHQAEWDAVMK